MNIINENITKFRVRAGLSQSDLARLLNVSPQAISRWERTGTPDTTAMPKIAAALGCTPNDLYGISSTTPLDTEEVISQDLRHTPREQHIKRATALAWHAMKMAVSLEEYGSASTFDFLTSCEDADLKNQDHSRLGYATDCSLSLESGIMLASTASNFKYVLMMPEPEEGFSSIMKSIDSYRTLFALLSRPYRLQVFLMGYSVPREERFTRDYVCAQLGIEPEVAQEVLDDLLAHHLLESMVIHTYDGRIVSYRSHTGVTVVPFLCFSQYLMFEGKRRTANATVRMSPLFKTPLPSDSDTPGAEHTGWNPDSYKEDQQPSTSMII